MSIQSGRRSLVIVSAHFEPQLTLRRLRERLLVITPHWPSYPNAVVIILGDFNKEGKGKEREGEGRRGGEKE